MRFKEKSTSVIFVRHGKTDFPMDRIYCDDVEDPPLNREGLAQAEAAARLLKGTAIDQIYASPAARTQATAEAVAEAAGLAVQAAPAWVERRFGAWEGRYFKDIEEQDPAGYAAWKQDPVGYTPQGGETIPDVQARIAAALKALLARHSGETVVLVSHVGPIRLAVTAGFEIPVALYRQIRIDYASISQIDYGETRNNLIYLNRVGY